MTQYAAVWHLTRDRLDEIVQDLSDEQSNWKPFPNSHSVIEYLYHVAGVEYYYYTILAGVKPNSDMDRKLLDAVANAFLKEGQFPFRGEDLTKDKAQKAIAYSGSLLRPVIENPSETQLNANYVSAQNANIDGHGAFVRVCQHAGYHTGQIYLLRCNPGFPRA